MVVRASAGVINDDSIEHQMLSPLSRTPRLRMPDLRATWVVFGRNYLALWFLFADAWYVVPASAKAIAGFEPGSDAILYASAAAP